MSYNHPPPTPTVLLKSKSAYSFWLLLFNDFPKVNRASLGKKIDFYFLELLESIFTSLYLPPQQKVVRLSSAIAKLDALKFFLQLAWENKCISQDKYAVLSSQLDEIGKMLGGWKKGLEQKEQKTPAPV